MIALRLHFSRGRLPAAMAKHPRPGASAAPALADALHPFPPVLITPAPLQPTTVHDDRAMAPSSSACSSASIRTARQATPLLRVLLLGAAALTVAGVACVRVELIWVRAWACSATALPYCSIENGCVSSGKRGRENDRRLLCLPLAIPASHAPGEPPREQPPHGLLRSVRAAGAERRRER